MSALRGSRKVAARSWMPRLVVGVPLVAAALLFAFPGASAVLVAGHGGAGGGAPATSPELSGGLRAAVSEPVLPEVLSTVAVGGNPVMSAYDAGNGFVYVANLLSDNVTVLNGTSVVTTLNTGGTLAGSPDYILYDPGNGFVYVVDRFYAETISTGAVTVVNGTAVLAIDPVGADPSSAAYDPADGYVYVPNAISGNVSVLNGTEVIASVPVGAFPTASAYDPAVGAVLVTNQGSDNVSALNGTSVVQTVAVGSGPDAVAYDPASGAAFVANNASGTVSVLDGLSVTATLSAGNDPTFVAYDPAVSGVAVTNFNSSNVTFLNDTAVLGAAATGAGPLWAAYDPSNGLLFVIDYRAASVTVLNGTVALGNVAVGGYPTSALYDPADEGVYVTNSVSNSTSILATAYAVTFVESGLAPGTAWAVSLDSGTPVSSNQSTIAFAELPGSYSYAVTPPAGYAILSESVSSPFSVVGANVTIDVQFGAPSSTPYALTFEETGLSSMCMRSIPTWSVTVGNVTQSSSGSTITFSEPNGTYRYTVTAPSGYSVRSSTPASPVSIAGAPVTVEIVFAQGIVGPQSFTVTFQEQGLPYGTAWCVALANLTSCSGSGEIRFSGLANGSYNFSVAPVSGYNATPAAGTVTISGRSVTVTIDFQAPCTPPPPCGGGGGGDHDHHPRCHHDDGGRHGGGWGFPPQSGR
jgi:DNA-binding beta-propeller fold protein YncE